MTCTRADPPYKPVQVQLITTTYPTESLPPGRPWVLPPLHPPPLPPLLPQSPSTTTAEHRQSPAPPRTCRWAVQRHSLPPSWPWPCCCCRWPGSVWEARGALCWAQPPHRRSQGRVGSASKCNEQRMKESRADKWQPGLVFLTTIEVVWLLFNIILWVTMECTFFLILKYSEVYIIP